MELGITNVSFSRLSNIKIKEMIFNFIFDRALERKTEDTTTGRKHIIYLFHAACVAKLCAQIRQHKQRKPITMLKL